jgi:hypothetical protein
MTIHSKPIFRQTALVVLLLASGPACAEKTKPNVSWPLSSPVQTATDQQIPAGALGVVLIDAPREATLLQLRGMAGLGIVILRSEDSRDCLTLPLRFVAGDFGGDSISAHSARPIRLIIRSARVARALARGDDVVSDMYRVGTADDDQDTDIIVKSGLSEGHGFVLNPGSSILADIVGVKASRVACSEF